MGYLSQTDLEEISEFLGELYAEVRFEHLPILMLDGLVRLIPAESSSYNEIDSETNSAIIHMRPEMPLVTQTLAPALEAHFSEHPQLSHYRTNADRKPYQFTDFLSHRQFREMGIYREFYRFVGTENQLTCVLSEMGSRCDVGIGINRKHGDFDERDRAVLEFLRPHLIRARHNALAFSAAQRRIDALEGAADEENLGVATLDREGRVEWATGMVLPLLARYFSEDMEGPTGVPELLSRWIAECRRLLDDGTATVETLDPLVVAAVGSRLKIRWVPGQDETGRLLLSEEKVFSARERARALGLTAREGEVMHWMVEGKTNPEIAAILGTSFRTIDKHVERILAKLDVRTRTAAVREVLSRVPGRCE